MNLYIEHWELRPRALCVTLQLDKEVKSLQTPCDILGFFCFFLLSCFVFSQRSVFICAAFCRHIVSLFFTPLLPLNFFWYLIQFLTLGKVPHHDGVPEWSKSQTDEGTHLLMSSFGATICGIICVTTCLCGEL